MTNYIEDEQIGLCSTCIHNVNCSTRQYFRGKILQCEEFDDKILQEHIPIVVIANGKHPVQYAPFKGLCMNCDLVSACTFPKPETGVWHCNEYK